MPQSFFGFWDIWSCLTIRKFWWCFFVLIMFDMLMEILPDCGGLPMDNPLIVCENSSFQCQSFLDLVPKDRIWKLSLSGNDLSGRFQRRTCRSFLPGSDAPDSPCLVAKSERNPCCCEIRGASFWVMSDSLEILASQIFQQGWIRLDDVFYPLVQQISAINTGCFMLCPGLCPKRPAKAV